MSDEEVVLSEEAHVCLPITGEDERGPWWSKHTNAYRSPELIQELECNDPTPVERRMRKEDFGE